LWCSGIWHHIRGSNIYQTTRCHNSEDQNINLYYCRNIKSQTITFDTFTNQNKFLKCITVFWNVGSWYMANGYQLSEGTCSPYSILKIEAASLSKILVPICKPTQNHIPKDHVLSNSLRWDLTRLSEGSITVIKISYILPTLICNVSFTYIRH
jgi:hypothetical protein